MVGEWTGNSGQGVPFVLTISPTLDVEYTFGGRPALMHKPTVNGQTVTIQFFNPGNKLVLVPTGPNSGTWEYSGTYGLSKSTISRKTS